jgi:hypothetical protein
MNTNNFDLLPNTSIFSFYLVIHILKILNYINFVRAFTRNVSDATDNGWFGLDHSNQTAEDWGKDMLKNIFEYITEFINEFTSVEYKIEKVKFIVKKLIIK